MTQNRETSERNPVSDFECSALALESKQRWMWLLALRASSIGEVIAPAFKGGAKPSATSPPCREGMGNVCPKELVKEDEISKNSC